MASDFSFKTNALSSLNELAKTVQAQLQQFLGFTLKPNTKVFLPVQQLSQVVKIPIGKIVPIPDLPPWIMGVYNWRGEVLWMIDLGALVGLDSWNQQMINQATYEAIVIKNSNPNNLAQSQHLGLIVSQIDDIQWLDPNTLKSIPSSIEPQLADLLQGYWLQPDNQMCLLLNGQAVIEAMPH